MSATQPRLFQCLPQPEADAGCRGRPRRGIPHARWPVDIHGKGSHRVRGGFCFENP
jgi:hypothetical protein